MTRTGQLTPTTAASVVLDTAYGPIAALRCPANEPAADEPAADEPGDDEPGDDEPGDDEPGDDVLLLPGFTGSKEDFTPLLDPLADHGFRVTAIDLPGQYQSPGPADPRGYTPDELASAVLAVAQTLRGPVHLVGHSFGGLVARAAVIAKAELFSDLVLMSSGPSALGGLRRERIELLEPILPMGLPAVYAAMQQVYAGDPGYVVPSPELAVFLERRFVTGAAAMLQGMGTALRNEPDRVAELAETRLPILVLFGADDDAWAPSVQQEMAGRLGADVTAIPAATHSPAVENTEATAAALLAFWARPRPA